MNSGVECHLASPATRQATRDAKRGGHPTPAGVPRPPRGPGAAAPVTSGAGRVFARPAGPEKAAGAGPRRAATRGPRARPTWAGAEARYRVARSGRARLVRVWQPLLAGHGGRRGSASPPFPAPSRRLRDVPQTPHDSGEAASTGHQKKMPGVQ